MARGFPDFFGTSVFYKYGAFEREYSELVLNPAVDTDVLTISGKGRIYNGWAWSVGVSDNSADTFELHIDGEYAGGVNFTNMLVFNIIGKEMYPVSLVTYDPITYTMSVMFGAGITFGYEAKVTYKPSDNNQRTVTTRIYWSEVA